MRHRRQRFCKKSLPTVEAILKLIDAGKRESQIVAMLKIPRQNISYYIDRVEEEGLVRKGVKTSYRPLELTPLGKKFLREYDSGGTLPQRPPYRLENIRYKARVIKMPSRDIAWDRVEMNNWHYHKSEVDSVYVKLNVGEENTIEFTISGIDGNSFDDLHTKAEFECLQVIRKLESRLEMAIGMPERASRPEYVVYDAAARFLCRRIGQLTVDGFAKMNASRPLSRGEFEFHTLEDAVDYILTGRRTSIILEDVQRLRAKSLGLSSWSPHYSDNN